MMVGLSRDQALVLTEPLREDYRALVASARSRLRDTDA